MPPPIGLWAVSVDAAINDTNTFYGVRCIIRDYRWVVLAAKGASKNMSLLAPLEEAKAMTHDMSLAIKSLTLNIIIFKYY